MAERIQRKTPEIVPRGLAPVYQIIGKDLEPQLSELKRLAEKRNPTRKERGRAEVLLTAISGLTTKHLRLHHELLKKQTSARTALESYGLMYGHVPGNLAADAMPEARCAANTIALTTILSALSEKLGDITGVLSMPGHVAPTVSIHNKTFVLDAGAALPLHKYLQELYDARFDTEAALHPMASSIAHYEDLSQREFNSKIKHSRGQKASFGAAHHNLGVALYRAGAFKLALKNYLKAGKLDPNHAPTYFDVANCFLQLKQPKKATPYFVKAAEADPHNIEVQYVTGLTLYQLGRLKEAENQLAKAVQANPDSKRLRRLLAHVRAERKKK